MPTAAECYVAVKSVGERQKGWKCFMYSGISCCLPECMGPANCFLATLWV